MKSIGDRQGDQSSLLQFEIEGDQFSLLQSIEGDQFSLLQSIEGDQFNLVAFPVNESVLYLLPPAAPAVDLQVGLHPAVLTLRLKPIHGHVQGWNIPRTSLVLS